MTFEPKNCQPPKKESFRHSSVW